MHATVARIRLGRIRRPIVAVGSVPFNRTSGLPELPCCEAGGVTGAAEARGRR